jgi:nitrogenase-associated protein
MKKVIFYEKASSAEDSEQKAMLAAAGYSVETRDLVGENWTPAGLRAYFAERPVDEWFDPRAPRVLSGEINPKLPNPQEALVMLSIDPSLIHGPLVKINGHCGCGLEGEELREFLDVHARGGKPKSVKRPPNSWGEDAWSGD